MWSVLSKINTLGGLIKLVLFVVPMAFLSVILAWFAEFHKMVGLTTAILIYIFLITGFLSFVVNIKREFSNNKKSKYNILNIATFRFVVTLDKNSLGCNISIKDPVNMKNPLFYTIVDEDGLLHIFIRADLKGFAEPSSLIKIEKETQESDDSGILQDDNNIFCNFNNDDRVLIKIAFIRVGIRLQKGGMYKLTIQKQDIQI